ncbi:Vps62-related protein [Streptomyces sp. NPDC048659]|uniref:Vps62-related protein n=1 Tax=Streptomyces sp. NPDC048659 TaxID=3155489 RepID=UPI00341D3A31
MALTPNWKMTFGELTVAFTNSYHKVYDNNGAKSDYNGTFYYPLPTDQMKADGGTWYWLGGTMVAAWNATPSIPTPMFKVPDGSDILQAPTGWSKVWDDDKSGADMWGSCWNANAPSGYMSLGPAFSSQAHLNTYYAPGSGDGVDTFRCVREDYVHAATIGSRIWNDDGSGAQMDLACWNVVAIPAGQDAWNDGSTMLMAVNSYLGVGNYGTPSNTVYVLKVPTIGESTGQVAQKPSLTSTDEPAEYTDPVTDHRVIVPCSGIKDPGKDAAHQVSETPFYTLEREVRYHRVLYRDNTTGDTDQDPYEDVAVGVSDSQSSTFSADYNIDVGFSLGVSIGSEDKGSVGGQIGVNHSVTLGYATTTSVAVMQTDTMHMDLHVPAGQAGALWAESHRISPRRMNGESVASDDGLGYDLNGSTVSSTYPHS